MPDGYRVLSFRSGLFAQCIGIVTDGFGHDADSHCIRIKCFRTCSDSGILIPERLRSKSDRRRVLRFLAWFHNGVVLHRRVVVIRNTGIRRGSIRRLFADVGSSSDRRAIPCGAVCRCLRSEYGRMIAFRFCSHTDCKSDFAQSFRFTTVRGGVIGFRFRQYADCQRIIAFCLGTIRHGNSSRSLRFRCLSDSYAPAAGRFRFRTDSDITGPCCASFLANRNGIITRRAVIIPVRSGRFFTVICFDGEIMNRSFVHFGAQCFQLAQIDGIGIFRRISYIDNLAEFLFCTDRNGTVSFSVQVNITKYAFFLFRKSCTIRYRTAPESYAACDGRVGIMSHHDNIGDFDFFFFIRRSYNNRMFNSCQFIFISCHDIVRCIF